jgi:hypothetical protein
MAGTYVAAWPTPAQDGAGYLQTGYYFGFFFAAALNYDRRAFRLARVPLRFVPVIVAVLCAVKEPERWKRHESGETRAPAR